MNMNLKKECFNFLTEHLTTTRTYTLEHNNIFHVMDCQFIVAEVLDASDEELYTILDILRKMEPSQDNLHQFLSHMAALYISVNVNS